MTANGYDILCCVWVAVLVVAAIFIAQTGSAVAVVALVISVFSYLDVAGKYRQARYDELSGRSKNENL